MRKYFIHNGHSEMGPFDFEELKNQQLNKDTPIWYQSLEFWVPANEVDDLKPLFSNTNYPPPLQNKSDFYSYSTSPTTIKSGYDKPPKFYSDNKKANIIKALYALVAAVIFVGVIAWFRFEPIGKPTVINNDKQEIFSDTSLSSQPAIDFADANMKEERRKANEALTAKYMGYRNNWKNFINVSSNNYTYSAIGGIFRPSSYCI